MHVQILLASLLTACFILDGQAELQSLVVPLTHVGYDVLAHVKVGTPRAGEEGQKLKVLFDTGSYNTWFIKKENTFAKDNRIAFDESRSTSYTSDKKPFKGKYGTAEITGILCRDKLQIGYGPNAIVLEDEQFGLASEIPVSANDLIFNRYDAIIGMDLVSEELAPQGAPAPFLTITGKKYEKVPVIGFYINRLYDFKSKMMFNANDISLYTGKPNTHAVVKQNNLYNGWKLNLVGISLKKKEEQLKTVSFPEGTVAQIITRMNALLVGPVDTIEPLNEAIFKDFPYELERSTYSFTCQNSEELSSALRSLPSLTVRIDAVDYIFAPIDYIRRIPGELCRSVLIGADVPGVVLGLGFMTKYYTRFDYENKQVQFAKLKP